MPKIELEKIGTERRNPRTMEIDTLSTLDMVQLINREDQAVIDAVGKAAPEIATAIDAIVESLKKGGRLIYMGAGTSGRLGVLDASECLPTFGVGEEMVIGIIAGGDRALRHPVEAAEDNELSVIHDLTAINFNDNDILCAIASSGRTPYCLAGLEYADAIGAKSIALVCVDHSEMRKVADITIEAVVGEEVITGSTRMKSGSAQKMILNMLSSCAMIKLGKVYSNLMVDVRSTNEKLIERARKMLMAATGCDYEIAKKQLEASQYHVKSAIIMELLAVDFAMATELLQQHDGDLRSILQADTQC